MWAGSKIMIVLVLLLFTRLWIAGDAMGPSSTDKRAASPARLMAPFFPHRIWPKERQTYKVTWSPSKRSPINPTSRITFLPSLQSWVSHLNCTHTHMSWVSHLKHRHTHTHAHIRWMGSQALSPSSSSSSSSSLSSLSKGPWKTSVFWKLLSFTEGLQGNTI